jgi:Leucine-rich repeat (LRR) protein
LKVLYCSNNQLQNLPTLPETLKKLCCTNNQLQNLPTLPPNGLKELYCYNNPLIFVRPLVKRPRLYKVPKNLRFLHSPENYSNYYKKYHTYFYLITYLALELNVSSTILSRERWLFFL